jgi:S-DNA-T family DNA segregation ATPase FtsK/SpoIIIE
MPRFASEETAERVEDDDIENTHRKNSRDTAPKASVVKAPRPQKGSVAGKARNDDTTKTLFSTLNGKVFLFFFIVSVYLMLSISMAPLWPQGWKVIVGPGLFLARAFSWAAFYIPAASLFAAVLFMVPKFLPRATYLLASSVFPFLAVAAFAKITTEPGAFFENHPVFAAVGLSSLYAGLGFLLAAALAAVIFGYVKLGAWLRSSGRLPEKKAKDKKSQDQPKRALFSGLRSKFRQWAEDRRTKKSKAEIRLREAQSLSMPATDISLPELPPLQGLRAGLDRGQDKLATPSAGLIGSEPGRAEVRADAAGHEDKKIEFTSVPPQAVSGSAGALGEEEKKALVQRIIERKKKIYAVPVDGILNTYPDGQYWIIDDKTRRNAEILQETLAEFSIQAEVTGIRKGPVITMYEILPAHGVKISKITNLSDNIALRLAASTVRIVAPIPGKHAVGIEVPNEKRAIVSLREIIEHDTFKNSKMEIPYALGKDISGGVQFSDLTQMPHLLIAGATGSGKSVCVNAIILSVLYKRTPEEVKLILIDPKIVELKLYNGIPHLLTPVITESKKAFQALQYCICEMERRYSILDKAGVRDIKTFNRRIKERGIVQERLPYIVVIVDEFADLMATTGKELEATLARLAAMSRAVGIHLVLATQRPSIDVITGLIKANIPSRIAFMVASKFDSRIIIDMVGAEKLLGRGDMLYSGAQDPFPVRMQGAFVSEEEVERCVAHVKTLGEPEYIDEEIFFDEEEENAEPGLFDDGESDPLFEKALEIVMQQGKASASYIQRRLKIGYNRSARLVELMEERGIVGPAQGSKPRDILRNPEVFGGHPDAGQRPSRFQATTQDAAGLGAEADGLDQ